MRKVKFVNNEYFHIYNRGIDKRDIFLDDYDYLRFLKNLKDFNSANRELSSVGAKLRGSQASGELSSLLKEPREVVEVVAYSLAPNHFHFILRQLSDNGIPNFMHKIGTSLTNSFNKKNDRSGSLMQGPYKAIHIENYNYLVWLSGYINGNVEIHKIKKADFYPWSSFGVFLGNIENKILNTEIILSQFKDSNDYKNFVYRVISESSKRKDMTKYLLE